MLQRDGKMGAVRTKPLRGSARPPPFPQSAFGYSEKWLRILLRATPRDPIEMLTVRANNRTDLGVYIRRCSFNKRLRSRVSEGTVAHISSLCCLQKLLLMLITGHLHADELRRELNVTLAAISAILRTVIRNGDDSK